MGTNPPDRESTALSINPLDKEELIYIAAKFNCTLGDVIVAISTTKSHDRAIVYAWLKDYMLGQL